jgi:hypothetical protein
MVDEIKTTQIDYLTKEKEDMQRVIEGNQKELEKMVKITNKYVESLAKQSKQESNAIEMLKL